MTTSRLSRPFLIALLVLLAIARTSSEAHAETRLSPLEPIPGTHDHDSGDKEPYSAGLAFTIPLLATALSVGAISLSHTEDSETLFGVGLLGLAVGPSLGHVYTGDWTGALVGTGLRTGGAAAFLAGALLSYGGDETSGFLLVTAGGLSMVGGLLHGLVDAPFSAVRANEKQGRWTLTPAPVKGPSQSTGWGAQMQMTF